MAIDLAKYKEEFQKILCEEVDDLFPEGKSGERGKALLLITILSVKFEYILEEISNRIKQEAGVDVKI